MTPCASAQCDAELHHSQLAEPARSHRAAHSTGALNKVIRSETIKHVSRETAGFSRRDGWSVARLEPAIAIVLSALSSERVWVVVLGA